KAQLLEAARAAAAANRNDAQSQTDLGWALYGAGRLADAAEQFKRALMIDMNIVDAHYGLALASKALNLKEPAIAAFEKVASLATQLDDPVRGGMLRRLAHGQINEMKDGDWQLAGEIWHREP
ncbi:MAG: hypothetical protein HY260_05540, partial [Chloroflexi bacterium]|nr:hypothetical protein [Chloroflexota bacterium]